ncbi:hypothetical protein HMPREF9135_0692 [Segatella baroniae F0067]|uniref:Uncharacterized protein n=1 Tax=Segatella baroniae F0067 TaxID=1115809 RepID=U2P490_9BACT|nr:hypothetical protein HMPREF9135_0692 [Segatella baroniae F0067]
MTINATKSTFHTLTAALSLANIWLFIDYQALYNKEMLFFLKKEEDSSTLQRLGHLPFFCHFGIVHSG